MAPLFALLCPLCTTWSSTESNWALNTIETCVCVAWNIYSLAQSHISCMFVSKQLCWTASLIRSSLIRSSSSRTIIIALLSPPCRSLDWGRSLSFPNMHSYIDWHTNGTMLKALNDDLFKERESKKVIRSLPSNRQSTFLTFNMALRCTKLSPSSVTRSKRQKCTSWIKCACTVFFVTK